MTNWENREQKEAARTLAVTAFGEISDSALMLPASDMYCVRKAIETGLFDQDTRVVCIERDAEIFREMALTAEQIPVETRLLHGELHELVLSENFDYAFFDFNGQLTLPVVAWLDRVFSGHITSGATVAFTSLYAHRNNQFIHSFHRFVASPEISSELWQTSFDYLGIADETIAMYLLLFRFLFIDYDFIVETPVKYRDTQSMLLFILRDFRPGNPKVSAEARESFEKFLNSQLASMETCGMGAKLVSKGTAAALKAWKTRRKNATAMARKRSNAAQKAPRTKKRNDRSDAAKKAWDTRRGNGATIVVDEAHYGGLTAQQKAARTRKRNATILATKRSNAAKKAWATRRANA